jgi:putative transposase
VQSVSTRKVDDLVKALGVASGISRSEVSRICAGLDKELEEFRNRPLDQVGFPYVFADATYVKGRVSGRVVSLAVVVATGVSAPGGREVLGIGVGDTEDKAFWVAFFKGLRARGLSWCPARDLGPPPGAQRGHRLGVRRRVLAAMPGALHEKRPGQGAKGFGRDGGDGHPHDLRPARCQARQPSARGGDPHARRPGPRGGRHARRRGARSARLHGLPQAHWRKLWSTNPLECLNGEIKRRTNVVGIFPNDGAVARLVTAVVVEFHDQWAVAERHYLSQESMAKIGVVQAPPVTTKTHKALAATA